MSGDKEQRASSLFLRAVELAEEERAEFLQRECGDDDELRQEVERLLAADALNAQDATGREFMEPPAMPGEPKPLDILGNDFELREIIGSGGFGTVYRAHQLSLTRDVAVKVMLAGKDLESNDVKRFHAEAKRIARIRHPGIVGVIANGQDGPLHWYAMDLVDGPDLRQEIQRLEGRGRPDSQPSRLPAFGTGAYIFTAARICAEAAEALHAAHENSIVHRDVKPGNLLLDRNQRVRLADFGIARDDRFGKLTHSKEVMGSGPYMSPEQARISSHVVDHRTDVYSLGVVLYQLLTLQLPFSGRSPEKLSSDMRLASPRSVRKHNSKIPRDLGIICHRAIERNPNDRFPGCDEFAADLRRFLDHEAILSRPPTLIRRIAHFARRYRAALALAGTLLIGALLSYTITRSVSAHQKRGESLQQVFAISGREDLDSVDEARLATALREGRLLLTRPDDLTPEHRYRIGQVVRHIERHTADLERDAIEVLVPPASAPTRSTAFDIEKTLEAYESLRRATVIRDKTTDRQIPANPFLPRLTVVGLEAPPAETSVTLELLDPRTGNPGERRDLGPLPIVNRQIPPRGCRVSVRVPGRPLREFTLTPKLGDWHLKIDTSPIAQQATTEMVRFPADSVTFPLNVNAKGEPDPHTQPLAGRTVRLRAFAIDKYEVSIGQYRAFLDAVGNRKPPPHFAHLPVGPNIDRLPITWISWNDARAYAEWAGKRLPTLAEWMYVARGRQMWLFPYEARDPTDVRGNVRDTEEAWRANDDHAYRTQFFLERARPVDAFPGAATPTGVFNMFGNAAEWIEGLYPDGSHPDYGDSPDRHAVVGGYWNAHYVKKTVIGVPALRGPGKEYAFMGFGFRCARTLDD